MHLLGPWVQLFVDTPGLGASASHVTAELEHSDKFKACPYSSCFQSEMGETLDSFLLGD